MMHDEEPSLPIPAAYFLCPCTARFLPGTLNHVSVKTPIRHIVTSRAGPIGAPHAKDMGIGVEDWERAA